MAGYIYPGQCVTLGFRVRLLIRAIAPIVLILAIPLGKIAFVLCRYVVQKILQVKIVQIKIAQAKRVLGLQEGEGHSDIKRIDQR